MGGILAAGQAICNRTNFLSVENCADPSYQRIALIAAVGLVFGVNQLYKDWQNHPVVDLMGSSILEQARCGNLREVKRRIAGESGLDHTDPTTGDTPLIAAARNGHYGVVCALLEAGATTTILNNAKESALHAACEGRFYEIADALLKKGLDPNAVNARRETPLMIAAKKGANRIVSRLISIRGIKAFHRNFDKQNTMHLAAKEYPEAVKLLGKKTATQRSSGETFRLCDVPDKEQKLPLHKAVETECEGAIGHLLKITKDVNAPDEEGNTPLHCTADDAHGRPKSAKVLLADPSVDPDRLNIEGFSALHIACSGMHGNLKLAKIMIKSDRFDLHLKTTGSPHETALDIVRKCEVPEKAKVIRLLEEKMGAQTEKNAILLPEGASFEGGAPLEKATVGGYSKRELESILVKELPLIEWATVQNDPGLLNALESKGIWLEISDANRDRLILAMIQNIYDYVVPVLELNPIIIREHQQALQEMKAFLDKPDLGAEDLPESVELVVESARSALKQWEILVRHKKAGTHQYGGEFFGNNAMIMFPIGIEAQKMNPGFLQMRATLGGGREGLMGMIPDKFHEILNRPRTLEELVRFVPVQQALVNG